MEPTVGQRGNIDDPPSACALHSVEGHQIGCNIFFKNYIVAKRATIYIVNISNSSKSVDRYPNNDDDHKWARKLNCNEKLNVHENTVANNFIQQENNKKQNPSALKLHNIQDMCNESYDNS